MVLRLTSCDLAWVHLYHLLLAICFWWLQGMFHPRPSLTVQCCADIGLIIPVSANMGLNPLRVAVQHRAAKSPGQAWARQEAQESEQSIAEKKLQVRRRAKTKPQCQPDFKPRLFVYRDTPQQKTRCSIAAYFVEPSQTARLCALSGFHRSQ